MPRAVPQRSVSAITPYSELGASSRVRIHEWAERIPEIRDVLVGRKAAGKWFSPATVRSVARSTLDLAVLAKDLNGDRSRTLLVHREVSTLGHGIPERGLMERADFSVYDFDDALHLDHGSGLRRVFPKRRIAERSVGSADRVIAANDWLADWASRVAKDVMVIPSCVDPSRYLTRRRPDGTISIVWLGSHSTSAFLFDIAGPLRVLAKDHDFRLRAIGATRDVASIGDFVDVVPWQLGIERDLRSYGDIGIMPMPDQPYTRGKSAYKALQYSAAGLPSVSSPVGASESIVDAIGGFLASTDSDWVDVLGALLSDEAMRTTRGDIALRRVRADFSYERWLEPFRSALELPPAVAASRSNAAR